MDNAKPVFVEMHQWQCASCGISMFMPEHVNTSLKQSHKTFYCIHGHPNLYSTKMPTEEIEGKLLNEYSKNAQLDGTVKKLRRRIKLLTRAAIIIVIGIATFWFFDWPIPQTVKQPDQYDQYMEYKKMADKRLDSLRQENMAIDKLPEFFKNLPDNRDRYSRNLELSDKTIDTCLAMANGSLKTLEK